MRRYQIQRVMADPCLVVPYHDPYDNDDLLNFINVSNPTLSDLSPINNEPFLLYPPPTNPQINNDGVGVGNAPFDDNNDGVGDASGPFDDPILWDLCNNGGGSSQAGPSQFRGETSNRGGENSERQNVGVNHGNARPLSVWPVEPAPFWCSCCQVLREIIHTNGQNITRLEIHGRLGMICHAILENRQDVNVTSSSGLEYHMFDFCKKSIENVKEFLIQYCDERKQAGFMMVQDPLSIFYKALCVGLEGEETLNTDDFPQSSPIIDGTNQMDHPEPENNQDQRPPPKPNLSTQRERTGKMTLEDLGNYFHLPIEVAAKRMNLCPTVVKKICRKYNLSRWPHRKIKSLERQIAMLSANLTSNDAEERANAQAKIQRLEQEISNICSGVSQ